MLEERAIKLSGRFVVYIEDNMGKFDGNIDIAKAQAIISELTAIGANWKQLDSRIRNGIRTRYTKIDQKGKRTNGNRR